MPKHVDSSLADAVGERQRESRKQTVKERKRELVGVCQAAGRGHVSRAAAELPWARTRSDGGGGLGVCDSFGLPQGNCVLLAHPVPPACLPICHCHNNGNR